MPQFLPIQSLLTSAGLIAISALAPSASAQTASDQDEARLGTITVTAQRVEEDLQDVPISVSAVSGEKLDTLKASGADVRFLSARVPSVIAESSFGRAFPRFYIRGIGNTDFDLNASQPVSLVYDDVPYESPILKGFPVFDLEQIEVLRGPQGSLFGRNTPGGIIKFDSRRPQDEFEAYVRASYGSYDTKDIEGAVNFPVIRDILTVRLSGIYQKRAPYVDNAFTGADNVYEGFEETAGRAQFLLTPSGTDLTALLNLHARSNDGNARLFRANIITAGQKGLGPGFERETVFYDGLNFLTQDSSGVTLRLDKPLSDAVTATYVFGKEHAQIESRGDIDGGFGAAFLGAGNFGPGFIPFASQTSGAVDGLDQITHELRFVVDNGGRLRAQAGVFLFDEEVAITSRSFATLTPGQPQTSLARRRLDTDSKAVFASVSFDVTDRYVLAGGARWSEDKKQFQAAGDQRELGDEQVSWDVSATYSVNENVNVYGRIAKGFRGPTVQQRFGAPSQAGSETVLSYEAGTKTELLDNRLRANLSIYAFELEDQQLTIVGGLTNDVSLFNADRSTGHGFEADIEAAPTRNLLMTTGLSYNKTEFKDDLIFAPGCGAPCSILDPAVIVIGQGGPVTRYNISGNAFPNAPEWIANVTLRYSVPIPGGELYGYTDWAYKGDTNFFLYESIEFGQDGYWEGGLKIGFLSDRGFDAAVFARNIFDEEALEGAIDFNNLTGFVNEPRTYGVQVRRNF